MKQLVVMADMEGASGIFDYNEAAAWHEEMYKKETLWRDYGRACITSDVLAVCNAALDWGIDEILLWDAHFSGCKEFNIQTEKLPDKVKLFDLPNRESHYERIRGQAAVKPFGIITVGQHARNGEPDGYLTHTIHTPPIESFYINGIHMAEIGEFVFCFSDIPYIANIGCTASHKEARELAKEVTCISVKDKAKGWEPTPEETYPIIYNGVMDALNDYDKKTGFAAAKRYVCQLNLTEDFYFEAPEDFPWKGNFEERTANWEAHDPITVLTLFWRIHDCIKRKD